MEGNPEPTAWHQQPVVKSILSCPAKCCACCGKSCVSFKKFIAKGSVVDLAIAVIIGNSFQKIVSTFTEGIVTPLIAASTGNRDNQTEALVCILYSALLSKLDTILFAALFLYRTLSAHVQTFLFIPQSGGAWGIDKKSALNFEVNGQWVRVGDFFAAILAFIIVAAICKSLLWGK